MTYPQFLLSMEMLKDFISEQKKLNDVLNIISPSSTGIVEFGNKFIDDYIWLIETALIDDSNWVSWFVFENDFGKRRLRAGSKGNAVPICDEKDLYNVCLNPIK